MSDNSYEIFEITDFKNNYIKPFYFEKMIIEKLVSYLDSSNIINFNKQNDFLPYDKCIEIMNKLKFTKKNSEYIDLYDNITHLKFEKNKKDLYLPIRPCKKDNSKNYKSNLEIPNIKLERLLKLLSIIDKEIPISYKKYLENSENIITKNYYFFENYSFIPIIKRKRSN